MQQQAFSAQQEITFGNHLLSEPPVRHIVGDAFAAFQSLPEVIAFDQFLMQVLQQSLPPEITWVVGQGLSVAQRHTLQQLQPYLRPGQLVLSQSENNDSTEHQIRIHDVKKIDARTFQGELLLQPQQIQQQITIQSDDLHSASLLLLKQMANFDLFFGIKHPAFYTKAIKLSGLRRLLPLPIKLEMTIKKNERYKDSGYVAETTTRFYQDEQCCTELWMKNYIYEKACLDEQEKLMAQQTLDHYAKQLRCI